MLKENNIMNIDESSKGKSGIDEMLERINKMEEDISHSSPTNKETA